MKKGPVIIKLEEQNRKFAYDSRRQISGEIQMIQGEGEARIHIILENLRPNNPKNYTYKVFFLGNKDGKSVYKVMGNVKVGRTGRGEMTFAVDPQNVDNKGTQLDAFFIFMIAAVPHGSGREPIQPVLKGDFQMQGAVDEPESQAQESRVQDEPVQHHPKTEEVSEETSISKSRKEYNDYYKTYVQEKTEQLIAQASLHTKLDPFEHHWLSEEWHRVADLEKLPIASLGAERQFGKYGHFIFSYNDDVLVLAVPGRHNEEEWPDRGISGFCLWQPIRNSEEYGYWSMVIERKTGIITEIS